MMKGKKIATRNKLAIFYSESDGYSVYAPDGRCLSSGYYSFVTAERYCMSNTMFIQSKKGNEVQATELITEARECEER